MSDTKKDEALRPFGALFAGGAATAGDKKVYTDIAGRYFTDVRSQQDDRKMLAEGREAAIEALIKKHMSREYGQHAGYLSAPDTVDIVLSAYLSSVPQSAAGPMTEDEAARLDKAFERMRKQRDDLKKRLFEALESDPILKEGLEQVDHAIHINRYVYSRVLDVACAQKARADEAMVDALGEARQRYVRVGLDGAFLVLQPSEGDTYVADARANGDESNYVVTDVYLSEREFDDLPEFDGF